MSNRYTPPMSLSESKSLLAGARHQEDRVRGWQAFGHVLMAIGGFVAVAYGVIALIGLLIA